MEIYLKPTQSSFWVRFGARLSKQHNLLRFLGVLSILLSAAYLLWRLVATWQGANAVLFWLLWSAEFIGWLSLALFVRDSWGRRTQLRTGLVNGSTAILIPTYNEDLDVLEPTIVGAMQVADCAEIWILDDGSRSWVKEVAELNGLNYLARTTHENAKAGNINNALSHIKTDFILVLDADHVPDSKIIEKLKPYFIDESVSVVQSPHGFRNRDSAQHYDRKIHEQSLFFEVLLPGRNATDAVFWCGSGAMLRLDDLQEVGGVQTSTITEDLETSLALHRHGKRTVFHNEVLLQGLAPANLASYLLQRYRWARGTIEVLTGNNSPIFGTGYSLSTRLSYLSNLVYYLVPFQHIAFVAVLAFALISGELPLSMDATWLLALWFPQLALSLLVVLGLSEGRQLPFSGSRNAWITSAIFVRAMFDRFVNKRAKFQVTPKDGVEEGGWINLRLLWLPILAASLLLLAVAVRLIELAPGSSFVAPMTQVGSYMAITFAVYELAVIVPVLVRAFFKRQHRNDWRFEVDLDGLASGYSMRIEDLHLGGLQFSVDSRFTEQIALGESFDLIAKMPDGEVARGQATAKRYVSKNAETSSVGASIVWDGPESRKSIIKVAYLKPIEPELT